MRSKRYLIAACVDADRELFGIEIDLGQSVHGNARLQRRGERGFDPDITEPEAEPEAATGPP
jgi:hypothetical protein